MYQALYRKYRPRTFEDVVGQEHVTETLRRQVASGRTSHAYLFVGPRGTGKTTCAKILARALNCEHPVNGDPCNECDSCRGIESGAILDVAEIDAASNNGVDNIRAIREEAIYSPAQSKKRVYIIDEVHMLSTPAFNALLKILEEPPEHLVFILATTELRKVPATILSRCQHFSFHRIMPENIEKRLRFVADQEKLGLTDGAAALLARLADGSMRDALSLLDQCVSSDTVDEEAVLRSVGLMGAENTAKLWEALRKDDAAGALELFDRAYFDGAEPAALLGNLLSLVRDMLMVRVAPRGSRAMLSGAIGARRLSELSGGIDTGRLLAASETLQEAVEGMRDASDKRVRAEICLVKLSGRLAGSYRTPEGYDPAPAATANTVPETPAPVRTPEPAEPVRKSEPAVIPTSADDGPPPWEDADAPPEGPVEPELPPQSAVSKPEPPERPEIKDVPARSPAPASGGDWWGDVLGACNGKIDGVAYTFLSNRDNLVPEVMGGGLILHAKNAFVKMMVDSAAVKTAVAQAATARLGRSLAVSVAEGMPESAPAEPGRDRLEELKKFEGIVKFK